MDRDSHGSDRPPRADPSTPTASTASHWRVTPSQDAAGPLAIGDRLGPYRILSVLGEGGMGAVYLAEQEHPILRRVAVKVVKLGMDTREVLARFESERQAMALLNHPNVATIIDAGSTPQGRPYVVMEYVAGIPITTFCDQHRLTCRERLDLFMSVCDAIHHAHQRGIIHRDLKPSNILVAFRDGRPVPKVIDFGVAKATNQRLTEKTLFTEFGLFIGTPEYVSPEQAEMSPLELDARTDVYSLGVVVYELLVGVVPFEPKALREAGYLQMQRILREHETPRPSTRLSALGEMARDVARSRHTELKSLRAELRNGLDWIALKALEKDRTKRYASVAELAADVKRYLDAEQVLAGPPGISRWFRRAWLRHKGVAALVLLHSLLVFYIGTSTRFQELELAAYDLMMRSSRSTLPAPRDIVIVLADEDSERELSDQIPFSRTYHARLLDKLNEAGARAVVFDLIFSEERTRDEDEDFADAIRRSRAPVVLARGSNEETRTHARFLDAGATEGTSWIHADADVGCRRALLSVDGEPSLVVQTFSVLGGTMDTGKPWVHETVERVGYDAHEVPATDMLVNYGGERSVFRRLWYHDILKQEAADITSVVKGKVVLVGIRFYVYPRSIFNLVRTPYWRDPPQMSDVEFWANALHTLQCGIAITRAPPLAAWGLLAGLLIGAAIAAGRVATSRLQLLPFLLVLVIHITAAASLFAYARIWMDTVRPLGVSFVLLSLTLLMRRHFAARGAPPIHRGR